MGASQCECYCKTVKSGKIAQYARRMMLYAFKTNVSSRCLTTRQALHVPNHLACSLCTSCALRVGGNANEQGLRHGEKMCLQRCGDKLRQNSRVSQVPS